MTTQYRITVMFPINFLASGGAERQLLELVKGIDKDRFKPLVVSLDPGGALEPLVREISGIELISLHMKGKYDFSILVKVFRLLRQKEVDIIQPFLTPATFFGLLPAIINRTPVKITTERRGSHDKTLSDMDNVIHRVSEDFLSRFADWGVSNSEAGKQRLMERGIDPSRIKVIYNGIDLKRLTLDLDEIAKIRTQMVLPEGGRVVGILASLTPVKDHATFLRAANLVRHVIPQTRFAVVGDGLLRASLEELARDLGLGPYVSFFGSQHNVGSYLSAFDVACLCSLSEGCSNSILEAMALGKPVVATNVGGNSELIRSGETGLLFPARSPEALAYAILACLSHSEWAREMGQRASQTVHDRFTWERMVCEYQTLYEEAMDKKSSRGATWYRR